MNLFRRYISEALNGEPVREPLDLPVPSDLADIADLFDREGEELYIVGGAVRDTLLGKSPKDYDLATGAPPERTIELAEQIPGSRVDLTGKSFGVVRVKTTEGNEYEIATFRRDVGAGRRPDAVEFTDIETDVKRRDLTINALFYDLASGEVVDYVGGIDDLRSGTIKAVGDPAQRFAEDKLRILRAVRFAGRMGSDLDAGTRDAILRDNDLDEVSPERIHDEFVKGIKQAQSVQHFFYLIDDLELFDQILPGASVDPEVRSSSKDVPVQMALMLLDNDPISVRKMMREMKFTNDEVVGTEFLLDMSQIAPDTAAQLKKQFARSKLSPHLVTEFGRAADMPQKTVDTFLRFAGAPPSASPHDLMRQGLRGPEIGKAMEKAEIEAYQKMVTELRRFVHKTLLHEDTTFSLSEDMEKRDAVFNYMKKVLGDEHKWRKKRDAAHEQGTPAKGRMQGRLLKKIFARLADRSFIDSLVTVHWGRDWASIEHALKTVSSKDELSCAAYLPQDVQSGGMGSVGLLVKGHITLVANSMDKLWSGEGETIGVDFPQMKKTSGINKGVQRWFQALDFYKEAFLVFDKEDWKPDVNPSGRYRNEALVDNWKAIAVVFETVDELEKPENQELIEMANQRGLEVLTLGDLNDAEYDFVKKEWYPEKEETEAETPDEITSELRKFVQKILLEEAELTLSTKGLDPTQGLTAFMDEYESMSKLNPMGIPGDRYWYMGEVEGKYCLVMTNIKIDKYRNVIYFNSIQTTGGDCERQGFASEVMNTITDLADKHQVPIRLQSVPFGQKSVPRRSLVAWYKRAGFEQIDSDYKEIMMRQPR